MKVSFREALSLTRSTESGPCTFVFIGKGYNYPAAEIFSRYLCRILSIPLAVHEYPCITSNKHVNLFNTQMEDTGLGFLTRKTGDYRVIPFTEGLYTTKAKWGELMSTCIVVEVSEPTSKSMVDDISFACSLMGVAFDKEGAQAAADNNHDGGWAGILTIIDYAIMNFGGLNGHESVLRRTLNIECSYNDFRDSFFFSLPKDTADTVLATENFIDYTNRLIDDLALYFAIYVKDSEKTPTREVAAAFGLNEWFLRNRLLPRLRTMGQVRILQAIDRLTSVLSSIMKGEAVDGQAQIAATILLLLS